MSIRQGNVIILGSGKDGKDGRDGFGLSMFDTILKDHIRY